MRLISKLQVAVARRLFKEVVRARLVRVEAVALRVDVVEELGEVAPPRLVWPRVRVPIVVVVAVTKRIRVAPRACECTRPRVIATHAKGTVGWVAEGT